MLDQIAIILHKTKHPGNIGMTARAMGNMGFRDLRLSAPQCEINDESYKMAPMGQHVLTAARTFPDLDAATEDLNFLAATSARKGDRRGDFITPREGAARISALAEDKKIGILFGQEDHGLDNDALRRCHLEIRIPCEEDCKSLNLAAAVLVLCYELRTSLVSTSAPEARDLAPMKETEAMFRQLRDSLEQINYLNPQNPEHIMTDFRNIFNRAQLDSREVRILRGLFDKFVRFGEKKK